MYIEGGRGWFGVYRIWFRDRPVPLQLVVSAPRALYIKTLIQYEGNTRDRQISKHMEIRSTSPRIPYYTRYYTLHRITHGLLLTLTSPEMSETLNCRESSARFGSPRIASEIAAESTVSFPGDAGAGDRLTARGLAEGGDLGDDDLPGGVIDAEVLPIEEGFSIDFRGEALGGDDADAAEALGGDDAAAAEALGGDDAAAAEASGGDDAAAAAAVTGAAASGTSGAPPRSRAAIACPQRSGLLVAGRAVTAGDGGDRASALAVRVSDDVGTPRR